MEILPLHQDGYVRRSIVSLLFAFYSGASSGSFVPPEAKYWDAELVLLNFNSAQKEKVLKAVSLIKKVISSPEFKARILNHTYRGKLGFIDGKGLSNEEIYGKILKGAETVGNRDENNRMNGEIELFTEASKTIGYTYPSTSRIWMNTKYFNTYTPVKVADNLMHEWMHKLGFGHAMEYSRSRNYSVPYAIGYLVEELAKNYP